MGKIYFLIGGARSGKSRYAEELASSLSDRVAYFATAKIIDVEMEKRVAYHKKRRPKNWKTYEVNSDFIEIEDIENIFVSILKDGIDTVIIDCITNLLFRIINTGKIESLEVISNKIEKSLEVKVNIYFNLFLKVIRKSSLDIIIVSNEVGMGVVPYYPLGRIFRDLMGVVNKMVAAESDEVYFFVAGLKQKLK